MNANLIIIKSIIIGRNQLTKQLVQQLILILLYMANYSLQLLLTLTRHFCRTLKLGHLSGGHEQYSLTMRIFEVISFLHQDNMQIYNNRRTYIKATYISDSIAGCLLWPITSLYSQHPAGGNSLNSYIYQIQPRPV